MQIGLSRKHVFDACHDALKRMRIEYLDLYFCHRPDPETPIDETVWAMHQLIMQGKILYWGTSEWSANELKQAFVVAERHNLIPPTMEQPQYNLLMRDKVENEFVPLYAKGLGTTVDYLKTLPATKQIDYVESYFKKSGLKSGASIYDIYALVFFFKAFNLLIRS